MVTSKKLLFFGFAVVVVFAAIATLITVLVLTNNKEEEKNGEDNESYEGPTFGYLCKDSICVRTEINLSNINDSSSLNVCRLTCNTDIGTLWPKPSGSVAFSKRVAPINPNQITISTNNFKGQTYWQVAWQRFREMLFRKIPTDSKSNSRGKSILIEIIAENDDIDFNYDTFEGYKLRIIEDSSNIYVYISARNFYGTRHALETLSQLVVYDEFNEELVILTYADITDEPKFKHRGISMDTSRTFYPVDVIKRTINGLAMVKLNTFHWHITDAQSFPLEIKSRPELTRLGAYSPDKVYTTSDIRDIVEFAKARGVRVIPEFDAPAHVGEGWQESQLTMCYKDSSQTVGWRGHFDPTKDELYNILEDIYKEIVESFKPIVMHMGGDEVAIDCWNTSQMIKDWMNDRNMETNIEGFMRLWDYFQRNALSKFDAVSNSQLPIILWTSRLTEEPFLTEFLDKNRYIIQVWLDGNDAKIKTLLEAGYKLIISNSDALYLDCGVGWWVNEGLNWCSPYKTWQKIYNNRMESIAGNYIDQILGAEATIWSESIDEGVIDMRIWPRASALAERLWTNPTTPWANAEARLLMNSQLLVEVGELAVEPLQLEWCVQNENECPF
ncbi:hypothetical protein PVAND_010493 [Polypedilum vanderplanki]|uniref:Beta-hexosaminidase n=1 Tax=Polypedilum vanderplanki TaxID=319348 RepID=A0A9J6CGW6_POLVA|nr:hypothetical protein PVAND_010493 [Polypedilum vanderplanki]